MHLRRSDPVENLNSYVHMHGGVDMDARMRDVEWVKELVVAAKAVINDPDITSPESWSLARLRDAVTL